MSGNVMEKLVHRADAFGRRAQARLWPPFIAKRKALRDHLRRVFGERKIDCVFDVGANRGQYYRFLRHEVGYHGLIASFEPIPELAAKLKARAQYDAKWKVFDYALGAASGTAELNVTRGPQFSSILKPDETHTVEFRESNCVSRVQSIRIDTLDCILPELMHGQGAKRAYLKLDTQGYDLEVLRGGVSALPAVQALQSELSFVPIYQGMPSWHETLAFLRGLGFAVSGFFPVTVDRALRLVETDGVFVRDGGGVHAR